MTTDVFNKGPCDPSAYGGLGDVSIGYPPVTGMSLTRYAPLRRSPACIATPAAPRLACVKPAASVHPEPGSNSSLYIHYNSQSDPDSFSKEINALDSNYSRYLLVLIFQHYQRTWCFTLEAGCKGNNFFFLHKFFVDFFNIFSQYQTVGSGPILKTSSPPAMISEYSM